MAASTDKTGFAFEGGLVHLKVQTAFGTAAAGAADQSLPLTDDGDGMDYAFDHTDETTLDEIADRSDLHDLERSISRGTIKTFAWSSGIGMLLKRLLGTETVTGSVAPWQHSFTVAKNLVGSGALLPFSLFVEKGTILLYDPAASPTNQGNLKSTFRFRDQKVDSLELNYQFGRPLALTWGLLGAQKNRGYGAAVPAALLPPAGTPVFMYMNSPAPPTHSTNTPGFAGTGISGYAGSGAIVVRPKSLVIRIQNGLDIEDCFRLSNTDIEVEHNRGQKMLVTAEMDMDWDWTANALYAASQDRTVMGSIVFDLLHGSGTAQRELKITMPQFHPESPTVKPNNKGRYTMRFTGKARRDMTTPSTPVGPLTIDVFNGDSAAAA